MDHTHCFTCGRDLNEKIANISRVKDDRLYGLFPSFVPSVTQEEVEASIGRLKGLERKLVSEIVMSIPKDWLVTKKAQTALIDLICRRGEYVADHILERIREACWPGRLFDVP